MRLAELSRAGRSPKLPLEVELPDGVLTLVSLLRVLPGQRYVGEARWQGRMVLAKLLVGARAERHYQREREGCLLLGQQGLTTPDMLATGHVSEQGGWLLFDFIENASSLDCQWQAVAQQSFLSEAQQRVLGDALAAIGKMHSKGLWQEDLHLDNLLQRGEKLYLIDGAGIQAETPGQPLPRKRAIANLGVFFAQFPASLDAYMEELLVHYLLVNSEHALPLQAIEQETQRVRRWRLKDYLDKAGRDCSLFAVRRSWRELCIVRRDQESVVAGLLAEPDRFIAAGHRYKDGGTATVARVEHQGRVFIIKRYNIKHFKHRLSRFWRPSRAWHSWIEGNRLRFLGLGTPQPLAMREERWLGLRGRAYLITDYAPGQDILARFEPYRDSQPPENELAALDDLFAGLRRERISHGDLKGHNVLWHDNHWLLIDLDAVTQHESATQFARAYARDRARFLRNWPKECALYRLLDERIPSLSEQG
ncbi:lipopolysaccharide kinase (Kdo/WaaP) family protein [Pseudomonas duriflava]|uniref:Lipopolysaccharide kinase (Kdo/WaaP) family protein n=1 Tax=Pseudomonas duriflava TaxID=459528 RepID=A0A562QBT0_9PSED|nr:lipopolysaccharide kinase InaA family protein [Pseudomonas duriflava]TWI54202.1 lipopolysaccharide kinase (Kdo/WaaP) family protein [Pseudomonas duriflava]